MKKIDLLVLTLVVSLNSCNLNKEPSLSEADARIVIEKMVLNDSMVAVVDKINVFEIKKLTALEDSLRVKRILNSKIMFAKMDADHNRKMASITLNSAPDSTYYAGLIDDSNTRERLSSVKLKGHQQGNIESKDYINKAILAYQDVERFNNRAKNIEQLIESKAIDSVSFKGFIAYFNLLGADVKGAQIKKDSLYVFISEEKRLIVPNVQ